MTERAIDYPFALAERAYAGSLVPNKAQREKADFDENVRQVREHVTPLAVTEQQRDVLEASMVVFQRMYAVKMTDVLRTYIKAEGKLPRTDREMHHW